MGKKPDELENDIRLKREEISDRLNRLESDTRSGIESVKGSVEDKVSEAQDRASSFLDLNRAVGERPYTTLLGALGAGMALGMASESLGGGNSSNGNGHSNGSHSNNGRDSGGSGGFLGNVLSPLLGPAASTLQDEITQLVRSGLAEFRSATKQRSNQSES